MEKLPEAKKIHSLEFRRENITSLTRHTSTTFRDIFEEEGFISHEPVRSLIPERDKSVKFIGSVTNVFKDYLRNPELLPPEGYSLIQKCLRTRNMDTLFDDSVIPEWSSYFTALGAMVPSSQFERLTRTTFEFLSGMDIDPKRIRIHVSSEDADLLEHAREAQSVFGCGLDVDGVSDKKYYRHKYGMEQERVFGRNFNIALKHQPSNSFKDIGNIILVEKNSVPIAAEVGIGVSTLIARNLGLHNAVESSVISQIVPFEPGLMSKFSDTLAVSIVMFRENINPGSYHKSAMLRTNLVALLYFSKRLGLDIGKIKGYVDEYENLEFGETTGIGERLSQWLKANEKPHPHTSEI